MSPKLSIIIPCYNCEGTLREAVESCFKQGFKKNQFEIVMVDDRSTDQTREVMEQLGSENDNVHLVYHEQNQGGGATRNTAVEKTSSDVIYCLDSDDILPAGTLYKLFTYLQSKGCDGVCTHYTIKFNGSDVTDIDHLVTMNYSGEKIPFDSLLQKNDVMCGLYQVFMFTKSAFERAGGYPTEHGFDTQGFAWRFLVNGLIAEVCPDTFYLQRVNYKESYYLSEYNRGRINHNWQKILIENIHVFKKDVQEFILQFDCSDFTKNLFEEIRIFTDPFIANPLAHRGAESESPVPTGKQRIIPRSSLYGLCLSLKNKLLK